MRPPEDHDRMLQRLAAAQRRKLVANDHKGPWLAMTPMQMLARLEEEVDELRQAMVEVWPGHADAAVNNEALRAIRDEAADVANFAGFIVDAVAEMSDDRTASFQDYAFPDDDEAER